jgi:hypothetical protein
MRNLLAFLAAVVLIVGVTGWCRSWYAVETVPADVGKVAFRVDVNCLQIAHDARDGVRAVRQALERKETVEKAEEKAK